MKLALALLATTALAQPPAITTKSYDNARTGMNPHETVLTQASVAQRGLVLQTIIPLVGDARGMEAQPLIAPHVQTTKGLHDIMVLPSMANVVRGVDAETGAGLWQANLGTPIDSSARIDFHQINQHFGCLSTGVIVGLRWYGVCQISTTGNGTPESGRYYLFVLDIASGQQVTRPLPVQGTDSSMWKQRSALLYLPKANVIAFAHGSVYETAGGYTGGITVYDIATSTLTQLPLTSGIWMAGQGIVADADENMYAITGNGAFDPSKGWYGESFIKLRYANHALSIIDQWSPWLDTQRTGQAAAPTAKTAGQSAPSEAMKPVGGNMSMPMQDARVEAAINAQGQVVARVYPTMAQGEFSDEDWGSAGPTCIFALGVCVAAGKDGAGYEIRTGSLGGTTLQTVGTAANYAKLAGKCAWLTVDPGPVPCDPADPRTLNFIPNGLTAHLHETPPSMYDPIMKSWVFFPAGENAAIHEWAVTATGMRYIAQSNEYASQDMRGRPPGGMPGSMCSLSSNGSDPNSILLYCTQPYGDGNATITNGRLNIYDAVHRAADGSLKLLWSSERWGIPFTFNKFAPPVVWNGRVYVNNYSGGEMVFALGK